MTALLKLYAIGTNSQGMVKQSVELEMKGFLGFKLKSRNYFIKYSRNIKKYDDND